MNYWLKRRQQVKFKFALHGEIAECEATVRIGQTIEIASDDLSFKQWVTSYMLCALPARTKPYTGSIKAYRNGKLLVDFPLQDITPISGSYLLNNTTFILELTISNVSDLIQELVENL